MNVFIDANIYLNFISDPGEKRFVDLEKLVEDKKIKLVFPRITEEEILRRLPFVASSYWEDNIIKQTPNKSISELSAIKKTDEINIIESKRKEYIKQLDKLHDLYIESVSDFKKRLNDLRKSAISTTETNKLLDLANERKARGNPPGGNKIGDNLVWEILLFFCKNDDLTIISNDPDWRDSFRSSKKEYYLNPLLEDEWSHTAKKITLYTTFAEFLMKTAGIEISEQEIKDERLSSSKLSLIETYTSTPSGFAVNPGTLSALNSLVGTASIQPGSIFEGYVPQLCSECGNPLDCPNIYGLCQRCRRLRGLP